MELVSPRGVAIPALGLGTARMSGDACRHAVETAIDLGYRHIDTAQSYGNEAAVGAAIADSEVPREDFFIVTKIRRGNLASQDVIRSVRASVDRLDTTIDLLLIHGPSRRVEIGETIGAMNQLQAEAAVGHIGVSNFSVKQLDSAIDASETPIITNQVEYQPYKRQDDRLEQCIERDVMLTAYSPLARGRVLGDETLQEIGARYGKSEAQVALRWLLQQEMVSAIPKAARRTHQQENLNIFDFSLTADEMERIFEVRGSLADRLKGILGL